MSQCLGCKRKGIKQEAHFVNGLCRWCERGQPNPKENTKSFAGIPIIEDDSMPEDRVDLKTRAGEFLTSFALDNPKETSMPQGIANNTKKCSIYGCDNKIRVTTKSGLCHKHHFTRNYSPEQLQAYIEKRKGVTRQDVTTDSLSVNSERVRRIMRKRDAAPETFDPSALVADLESRKTEIERTISTIKQLYGIA